MCAHVINRNSHCYVSRSSGCCSPCREIQFWKWRVELWHLPLGDLQLRDLSIPWNDKPASARASGERWAKMWVGIHWLGWQGIRCYRCCQGTEGEQRCEVHPVCFWNPWVVWLLLCCNVRPCQPPEWIITQRWNSLSGPCVVDYLNWECSALRRIAEAALKPRALQILLRIPVSVRGKAEQNQFEQGPVSRLGSFCWGRERAMARHSMPLKLNFL